MKGSGEAATGPSNAEEGVTARIQSIPRFSELTETERAWEVGGGGQGCSRNRKF